MDREKPYLLELIERDGAIAELIKGFNGKPALDEDENVLENAKWYDMRIKGSRERFAEIADVMSTKVCQNISDKPTLLEFQLKRDENPTLDEVKIALTRTPNKLFFSSSNLQRWWNDPPDRVNAYSVRAVCCFLVDLKTEHWKYYSDWWNKPKSLKPFEEDKICQRICGQYHIYGIEDNCRIEDIKNDKAEYFISVVEITGQTRDSLKGVINFAERSGLRENTEIHLDFRKGDSEMIFHIRHEHFYVTSFFKIGSSSLPQLSYGAYVSHTDNLLSFCGIVVMELVIDNPQPSTRYLPQSKVKTKRQEGKPHGKVGQKEVYKIDEGIIEYLKRHGAPMRAVEYGNHIDDLRKAML